jgi:hypothetical protein
MDIQILSLKINLECAAAFALSKLNRFVLLKSIDLDSITHNLIFSLAFLASPAIARYIN